MFSKKFKYNGTVLISFGENYNSRDRVVGHQVIPEYFYSNS